MYRTDERPVDARVAWRALVRCVAGLPASPSHDAVTFVLIELGELEAAIADALFPERDALDPVADGVRRASLAAGHLFRASWKSPGSVPACVSVLNTALDRVEEETLPRTVTRRVSEGYAFYALHPETYVEAAERFCSDVGPGAVDCIGIRSIGTSLSAVVAATLESRGVKVRSWTVRPRGHPFDRELRLDEDLRHALTASPVGSFTAIVDEGPGLSGSSFAAAARTAAAMGSSDDRVAFFPGWNADGSSFRSDAARRSWQRHRRWTVSAADIGAGVDGVLRGARSMDWSAGIWRQSLVDDERAWPAVHAQHERVKRFLPESGEIVRFAGLGRYGLARKRRAETLASHGFLDGPITLDGGYLRMPFVPGRPCSRVDVGPSLLDTIPPYLSALRHVDNDSQPLPVESLYEMILTNCAESDRSIRIPALAELEPAGGDLVPVALDGRMQVHEFVRTGHGIRKVDALDHGDDHFFPGPHDSAWDLAAAEIELGLDSPASAHVLDRYARIAGDPGIARRMPFYRLAYAAFQLGYTTLAAESLMGSKDAQRFERRRDAFRSLVRELAAR